MEISFDTLPIQVKELHEKLDAIKSLLESVDSKSESGIEQVLTLKEASSFLELSPATIYLKVSKREIPYSKKGKRLYFLKSDLIDWIRGGQPLNGSNAFSGVVIKKRGGKR